jgi:hypothetical protein
VGILRRRVQVLPSDSASAIVADAARGSPRAASITPGTARFATDAIRVRSPEDKPWAERTVQYVGGISSPVRPSPPWPIAHDRAQVWCRDVAGFGSTGPSRRAGGGVLAPKPPTADSCKLVLRPVALGPTGPEGIRIPACGGNRSSGAVSRGCRYTVLTVPWLELCNH